MLNATYIRNINFILFVGYIWQFSGSLLTVLSDHFSLCLGEHMEWQYWTRIGWMQGKCLAHYTISLFQSIKTVLEFTKLKINFGLLVFNTVRCHSQTTVIKQTTIITKMCHAQYSCGFHRLAIFPNVILFHLTRSCWGAKYLGFSQNSVFYYNAGVAEFQDMLTPQKVQPHIALWCGVNKPTTKQ